MAAINLGDIPQINDTVTKIEIVDGGVRLHFESGLTFFGHTSGVKVTSSSHHDSHESKGYLVSTTYKSQMEVAGDLKQIDNGILPEGWKYVEGKSDQTT